MSDRLYKMATGGEYTPVVFQGSSINLPTPNLDILRQGWEAREARQNKAIEQQTAIDVALGKIQEQLNPNELEWFDDYKENINNQIQTQIDEGNYTTALRTATSLAGKVAKDKDILGRIKQQEYFKTAQDKVVNDKTLSDDTKEWWIANHQYNYNPTLGAQEITDLPLAAPEIDKLIAEAIQLAAPESYQGYSVNELGTGYDINARQVLDKAKLKENFDKLLESNPMIKRAIIQQKEVDSYTYNKLQAELANSNLDSNERSEKEARAIALRKELYTDNGIRKSDIDYIQSKAYPVLENAAYDNKQATIKNAGRNSGNGGNSIVGGLMSDFHSMMSGFTVGSATINMPFGNGKYNPINQANGIKALLGKVANLFDSDAISNHYHFVNTSTVNNTSF